MTERRSRPVAAIRRAVDVLRAFSAAEPSLSVTAVAARVGLHKSSASRILATLEDAGLVERDSASGRYQLGAGIVALAGPLLASLDLREKARPVMAQLAAETSQSVSLALWTGGEAVNVEQVFGPGAVAHLAPIGRASPGHASANGKVFLAWRSEADVEAYLARPLATFTPETLTKPDEILRELASVRAAGYAVNDGELDPSLLGISAPIRDHTGAVVASVGITAGRFGPARDRRARIERDAPAVIAAADRISSLLGWSP